MSDHRGAPPARATWPGLPCQADQELNANGLFDWLEDEQLSVPHGWQRVFETDPLQQAANEGHVAIIIAQRAHLNLPGHVCNLPGHVCAVVPETGEHSAVRTGAR